MVYTGGMKKHDDSKVFRSESLEFDFKMFLIFEYAVLPVTLIILRCFTMKCIPKCDIFWLYNCLTTWSWIGFLITVYGTNLYCTKDCGGFGGIPDYGVAIIIFCIITFWLSLFEPFYGCKCLVCKPLFLQFDPSPVDAMRDIITRIEATGPTLVVGAVKQTYERWTQHNHIQYWDLIGFEQFPYKSWVNVTDQNLEDVFNHRGPLVIKTYLEIFPANEETKKEYDLWSENTASRISLGGSTFRTRAFREELVTDRQVCNSRSHHPSKTIPSAQLPSLITADAITFTQVMEVKERLLCDDLPCWMNEGVYCLATCLLLGSVFRICYRMCVRVVKLHFKKAFNTQDEWESSIKQTREIGPYIRHIDGLNIEYSYTEGPFFT